MTIQNVFDIFDILQDKYGAPYFPDDWKVTLYNKATLKYLDTLIPDNQGGIVNFEFDSNVTKNIQPLIYPVSVSMDSTGLTTMTAINTILQSTSGDAGAEVLRFMQISALSGGVKYPVRYVKQNNVYEYQTNFFKKARVPDNIQYTMQATGLQFYPVSISTPLTITILKTPKKADISNLSATCEFSDYSVNQIIYLMLQDAGVATRDEELQQDIRMAQAG